MPTLLRCLPCLPLLAAMACAQGACPVDRPITAGSYEVGINYDPKTGNGFDTDIINELARRTGCHFDSVYDSRVRLWKQLTDGQLDMMVSVLDIPDREQYARFVIHSWARTSILARDQPDFPATPEAFLADRRLLIGTVKTYRYSPGVDEWVGELQARNRTYEAPDMNTLLKVFDAGRVAAIPITPEALYALGRRYQLQQPYRRLDWFEHSPKAKGGLALSRATLPEAVTVQFEREIDQMRKDGTLLRLAEKYFGHDAAVEFLKSD